MEIIDKREFAVEALNTVNETFLVYIVALAKPTTMSIYLSYQAQVALPTKEKTRILTEYSDFSNIFSSNSAAKLPEYTKIHDYSINLQDNKQILHSLIYSLGPVELEILKTYIKANLASSFIKPSKSPSSTLILFVQKRDSSLYLYINYQRVKKKAIINCYPLLLIG